MNTTHAQYTQQASRTQTERPEAPDLLAAALRYADMGVAVFPLHSIGPDGHCTCGERCDSPGQHARTEHGAKDATTDPTVIRAWWTRWPDANIGVATGDASGLVIVNVSGSAALNALKGKAPSVEAVNELLNTATVIRGEGRHFYFLRPEGRVLRRVQIAPGTVLHGDDGYIIAPPSRHVSGQRYAWLGGTAGEPAPAELPHWLLELADEAARGPTAKTATQSKSVAGARTWGLDLWHTPKGEPWATINGKNYAVGSEAVRQWLTREHCRRNPEKPPSRQRIQTLQDQLAAEASSNGKEYELHLRVAKIGAEVWLDLADSEHRAVRISTAGWSTTPAAQMPAKFNRPSNMHPLPLPEEPGDATLLRSLLNLQDENTFRLLLTWLTFTIVAERGFPLLAVSGPQGSAKSTFSRLVRSVTDPSEVPLVGQPRGSDLVALAKNNRMLCFDNLSKMPADLADDLCRLATESGFGGRQLYTNDGDASFSASRPVILNGINDVATRHDLANRALMIHLGAITRRRTEQELRERFEAVHPQILAGLLDAAVAGLKRLPEISKQPHELPRMADFALWGVAVAPALGWTGEEFLGAYATNQQIVMDAVIDDDPVLSGVLELIERQPMRTWQGTAEQLMVKIRHASPTAWQSPNFPRSPQLFGQVLARGEPIIADRGYVVDRSQRTKRARMIIIRPVAAR